LHNNYCFVNRQLYIDKNSTIEVNISVTEILLQSKIQKNKSSLIIFYNSIENSINSRIIDITLDYLLRQIFQFDNKTKSIQIQLYSQIYINKEFLVRQNSEVQDFKQDKITSINSSNCRVVNNLQIYIYCQIQAQAKRKLNFNRQQRIKKQY